MKQFNFTQNQFAKMHGTGNCFIIMKQSKQIQKQGQNEKNSQTDINQYFQKLAPKICDLNFGIGADGLLVIADNNDPTINAKYFMKVFNKDGSMANMCGNGLRCFCACLKQFGFEQNEEFGVRTGNGLKNALVKKQNNQNVYRVTVEMGKYQLSQTTQDISQKISNTLSQQFKPIHSYFIDFNVPHTVIILEKMLSTQNLIHYGKQIQKIIDSNVNFVEIEKIQQNYSQVYIRTYERGAGLTLACGSGSCASVVVGLKKQLLVGKVRVKTQGGILMVYIKDGKVMKDGPAQFICHGAYYL